DKAACVGGAVPGADRGLWGGGGGVAGCKRPLLNLTDPIPLTPLPSSPRPQVIKLHAWEGRFMEQIEDYLAEEAAWLNVEVIKLHAWEGRFLEQIEDYRAEEAAWLARYNYLMAANIVFLWMSPLLVASATFAACVAFEEPLSAASIFTAIATFRILQPGMVSASNNYLMGANIVFLWMSPLLVASATFAACVAFEEPLSAASIFTAIATFRILQVGGNLMLSHVILPSLSMP
ncbi:unnamed protein product, partial [Closterium sp. NIES-54]